MNYIYDILLNFHEELFCFFEWNEYDDIIHIKKIPIFKLSKNDYLNFLYNKILFKYNFLNMVYNKSEVYGSKNNNFIFLITDGNEIIGIKLNKKGITTHKSSLVLDEENDILDHLNRLKQSSFEYKIISKDKIHCFQTRNEYESNKFIFKTLRALMENKDYEKLKYLYLECFDKKEDDINKIYNCIKKEILKCNENYKKIFNFFKLLTLN